MSWKDKLKREIGLGSGLRFTTCIYEKTPTQHQAALVFCARPGQDMVRSVWATFGARQKSWNRNLRRMLTYLRPNSKEKRDLSTERRQVGGSYPRLCRLPQEVGRTGFVHTGLSLFHTVCTSPTASQGLHSLSVPVGIRRPNREVRKTSSRALTQEQSAMINLQSISQWPL